MNGPVLRKPLMDLACDQPRRDLRKHFARRADADADAVQDLLWKAYSEGLRDGFVQGVAAAQDEPGERKDTT